MRLVALFDDVGEPPAAAERWCFEGAPGRASETTGTAEQ
jgi:hypothetical protein